jgi:hypothetical protein
MQGALRERLATVELHHYRGRDLKSFVRTATSEFNVAALKTFWEKALEARNKEVLRFPHP